MPTLTDESDRNEALMSHYAMIRNTAWTLTRRPDVVDDLTQEGVARALEVFGRYRGDGELGAFLGVVARRAMLNHLRARRLLPLADGEHLEPTAPPADPWRWERDALDHCLPLLRDEHRAVLTLRRDGIKYDEVAKRTGLPVGTVKTRVSRAVGEVRKLVA